ncbi:hypothetical protein [Corynebacterium bovis]|uniref:hypothetical protein n=1 Tax=Corynebacterium bovis TaxID=36808 RepID=UPI0021AB4F2A|nr:hypothetical protein [Corynebacterium bovis]
MNTARREASIPKWSRASTPATPNDVRPVMARMYATTAVDHTATATVVRRGPRTDGGGEDGRDGGADGAGGVDPDGDAPSGDRSGWAGGGVTAPP